MSTYTSPNYPPAESYPFGGNGVHRRLMDSRSWNLLLNESQTNTPRKAISIMTLICLSTIMGFISAVAIILGLYYYYAVHHVIVPWDVIDYYGITWSIRNKLIWLDAHDMFFWLIFMLIWTLSTSLMYRVFLYVRFTPFREAKHKGRQDW
ncbi:hypothetical protein BDP55DRAFT_633476 [Colletotrichum godetiae]|uniref:Transmembrane protein n=1 Tax=Colletotrichum godetiae TaxID=1209918 RepID=A0AAJ0AK44_9PEZI|nr:uncharacterized protein BDP55DRAFT_633476 [Colletotrichum godetiae]KAK1673862.1 hypothetical protein BDP55DRAFT_633476 [Colletotrichum godetiae]